MLSMNDKYIHANDINHYMIIYRRKVSTPQIYRKAKELLVMNRAIKYRLYPTMEQKTMFVKTFGCCRKVYNLMLADKITCYK